MSQWSSLATTHVHSWYGGNETGNGIADIIFGDVNPSARLPLSFPKRIEDTPAYLNFESERGRVVYGESVYIGYRYYEKIDREVEFPFGYVFRSLHVFFRIGYVYPQTNFLSQTRPLIHNL